MYCPNCFAFIADDATICPKCNCAVKTDGVLPQEVIAAEVASQKQGYGFEKYAMSSIAIYDDAINNNQNSTPKKSTSEKIEEEEAISGIKTYVKIFVGCMLFELIFTGISILSIIIAIVISPIIGEIILQLFPKNDAAIKTLKQQKSNLDNNRSNFEISVLKPLEDDITKSVLALCDVSSVSFSLFESVNPNTMYGNFVSPRVCIIYEKMRANNIPLTLADYKKTVSKVCENWVRLIIIIRIGDDADHKMNDIDKIEKKFKSNRYTHNYLDKAKQIRTFIKNHKKRFASTDITKLPNVYIQESELKEYVDLQNTLILLEKTLSNEQKQIKQEDETLSEKFTIIKNDFNGLKDKVTNLLYYSKEFQETYHNVESFCLTSKANSKLTFDEQIEKIKSVEYSLKRLEELYKEEHDNADNLYNQQKKLADELTEELETVLSQNNDVKYGHEINSMIREIRKLISVYENGATALNTELVNDKIRILEKARKHQRSDIFNMIQNYDKQLRELQKTVKIYERPNAGKIIRKFLERKNEY